MKISSEYVKQIQDTFANHGDYDTDDLLRWVESLCQAVEERDQVIAKALEFARDGQVDGAHHKMWTIDQMVRALTSCPMEQKTRTLRSGETYQNEVQGESEEYKKFVKDYEGDGGEYKWDVGIP